MTNLIYFTIFGNIDYINLVNLLALSTRLFGDPNDDIEYLVITIDDFVEPLNEIFNKLLLNLKFYIIDNSNFLILLSSRLLIFNYEDINNYKKILYIDTDILITNNINRLFCDSITNKLYALEEGIISDQFHGREFFDFSKINPSTKGFTSGILLFNNCDEIKELFKIIFEHIEHNIQNNKPKPIAFDQAFINYHAINNNLYNNTYLKNLCINNPEDYKFNYHIISHFPGGVGNYEDKVKRMKHYFLYLYDFFPFMSNYDNYYLNRKFEWKHDCFNTNGYIKFLENNILETIWGYGKYNVINNNTIKYQLCNDVHILKFNNDKTSFISIRRGDNNVSKGIYTFL